MSRCIFCGHEGKLSREHIYPDWLLNAFAHPDPAARNIRHLMEHDHWGHEVSYRKRDEGPATVDPAVKCVCNSCNNGWMSRLEVRVKELLLQLAHGRGRTITIEDQRLVAFWAAKTMVIVEQVNRPAKRTVSLAQRRWLYNHRDDHEPFSGVWVYIGTLENPFPTPLGYKQHFMSGRLRASEPLQYATGQQITFNIARLVLTVYAATRPDYLDFDPSPALSKLGLDSYVRQIWPQVAPVSYPLRKRLNAKRGGPGRLPIGAFHTLADSTDTGNVQLGFTNLRGR